MHRKQIMDVVKRLASGTYTKHEKTIKRDGSEEEKFTTLPPDFKAIEYLDKHEPGGEELLFLTTAQLLDRLQSAIKKLKESI